MISISRQPLDRGQQRYYYVRIEKKLLYLMVDTLRLNKANIIFRNFLVANDFQA